MDARGREPHRVALEHAASATGLSVHSGAPRRARCRPTVSANPRHERPGKQALSAPARIISRSRTPVVDPLELRVRVDVLLPDEDGIATRHLDRRAGRLSRRPAPIGAASATNAYTDLDRGDDGLARVELRHSDSGLDVWMDVSYGYVMSLHRRPAAGRDKHRRRADDVPAKERVQDKCGRHPARTRASSKACSTSPSRTEPRWLIHGHAVAAATPSNRQLDAPLSFMRKSPDSFAVAHIAIDAAVSAIDPVAFPELEVEALRMSPRPATSSSSTPWTVRSGVTHSTSRRPLQGAVSPWSQPSRAQPGIWWRHQRLPTSPIECTRPPAPPSSKIRVMSPGVEGPAYRGAMSEYGASTSSSSVGDSRASRPPGGWQAKTASASLLSTRMATTSSAQHQVATAELTPARHSVRPRQDLRDAANVEIKKAEVVATDPGRGSVTLDGGPSIAAGVIVLAAGSQPNFFNTPGGAAGTHTALLTRRRRAHSRARAQLYRDTSENTNLIDQGSLTFVVIGGGATGVESASTSASSRTT